MKKLLIAVLASAVFAAPVHAQNKGVELGVSGYFKSYIVAVDQDDAAGSEARAVDIVRDTELHFAGERTLDNGLTVGADVGVDGEQGGSFDMTDSFVYFLGNWGRVNFGATDGAGYLLQVVAPAAEGNYDGTDQYYTPFNYVVTGVSELESIEFDYDHDLSSPHDKLTYISPLWSGFQLGVSYTPETKTTSRGLAGVSAQDDEADFEHIWDVSARFENDVSWGSYAVGAGYSRAGLEDGAAGVGDPTDDRTQWNMGVDLNVGVWGVGAVYTHDDRGDLDSANSDQRQWILGTDYTFGNYVLAASYLNQNNKFGSDEIDTNRYTAGVTWNYAPGVNFRGIVTHINHDVDVALGDDVSGTALMLGTEINF